MAAYGALVSLMNIIDQLQTHPHPPISIDQQQLESLTHVITSLQQFLQGYAPHRGYTDEEDVWESQIAEAAYHAEDVIESYIVDQILVRSRNDVQNITSVQFYQGLEKVIENMNLINIEVKEKMVVVQNQLHIKSFGAGSTRSSSTAQNVAMIGFDDVLLRMLDKITGGGLDLQILPVVGMGGIGKTTLARNIYVSPLVQQHFDACAWSTISQKFNVREILRQVLGQVDKEEKNWGDLSEDELGLHLYQYLIGRRYFIVMDDMWNIEAWDGVRRFFPDNRNGSRIVVTTRLSNLASLFNYSNGHDMQFLDKAAGWNLFSKTVFGDESCPLELESVGKKIVERCRGLPLAVVVIGGLLSKSELTKESWGIFEENLSSIVNLDDDESCLQVLYMSYNNLPVYLKPCFLDVGRFPEDEEILVFACILSWVLEGFVKPIDGKCLEEIAEGYIEELVDRNMLIVDQRKHFGQLKSFKMHDLLRDVCLREARKLKFLCVLEEQTIPRGINSQRRILGRLQEDKFPTPLLQSLESASLVRSFRGEYPKSLSYSFRLLRIGIIENEDVHEIVHGLVNLRILLAMNACQSLASSVYFLWNLQTLLLHNASEDYVCEIWKMPQLRHVIADEGMDNGACCLSDPLSDEEDMVLENLHTLFSVKNLKFGEGVLKRIPNIRMLKLYYERKIDSSRVKEGEDYYDLRNVCRLHKLETLKLQCHRFDSHLMREVSFPYSLKKLALVNTKLSWEDMNTKIGSLPLLQVLKLKRNSFIGSEWETSEDQFLKLKFLLIDRCDIECWITDNAHFPRLEHLVLRCIFQLEEIPSCIGDIPTLHSITVYKCSDSVVDSAQKIKDEQQELGNEDLQITVH